MIRAEHNRKVQHELTYLSPALEQAPVLGQQTIALERHPERPAWSATLTVRGLQVTIEVPRHHKQPKQCQPVALNVLLVEEVTPSAEGKPMRWLLLTTLPIASFEQAWQCVQWYSLRWLYACGGAQPYERFHFTLKSGCRLEQLPLETAQRLLKALATDSIVAWRLMWLTYAA